MTMVVLLSKSAVENPLCIAVVGMAKLLNVAVFEFIVCDFFLLYYRTRKCGLG